MTEEQQNHLNDILFSKHKIVNRIKELKATRDTLVTYFGKDKSSSVIFNRLTDTINALFGQIQDMNIQIDRVRKAAGLEPLYEKYYPLYNRRTA